MFTELMASGSGGGGLKVIEYSNQSVVSGDNTLTFSDFTEIRAVVEYIGSICNAGALDTSDNLINIGARLDMFNVTAINGNQITIHAYTNASEPVLILGY